MNAPRITIEISVIGKLLFAQIVKFPSFYGTWRFLTVFITNPLKPALDSYNIQDLFHTRCSSIKPLSPPTFTFILVWDTHTLRKQGKWTLNTEFSKHKNYLHQVPPFLQLHLSCSQWQKFISKCIRYPVFSWQDEQARRKLFEDYFINLDKRSARFILINELEKVKLDEGEKFGRDANAWYSNRWISEEISEAFG